MIQNVETTDWLTNGIPDGQLKIEKAQAIISAKIYTKRTEMGLSQKEFAKLMGVTQRMADRWESGTYDFSVSTLVSICEKLGLPIESEASAKKDVAPMPLYVLFEEVQDCVCEDVPVSRKLYTKGDAERYMREHAQRELPISQDERERGVYFCFEALSKCYGTGIFRFVEFSLEV